MKRVSTRRLAGSSSSYKTASLLLVTLLGGGIATVAGLWAAGVEIPFLKMGPDLRGKIAVPTNPRPILAYTKLTRDDLLVPETHLPRYMYLSPEDVKRLGLITDFNKIVGRVVDHDKPAFFPFVDTDFLPTGTRPGIVAAIPPGKRAITVDVTKIEGIHALKAGDRIDILSSTAIDMQKVFQRGSTSPGTAGVSAGMLAQVKQARVRVLVQNGALVSPVRTRVIPINSTSLTQGSVTRTKPIQEAILAVDPEEIAPLTEAIAIEASITCVARSGLPDDPGEASITPHGVDPSEHVAVIERVVGAHREVFFVAGTPTKDEDTKKLVMVPMCGKRIPAKTKVTFDHLTNPATGRLHQVPLRPADVKRLAILTDMDKIVGRVVTHEKLADSAFNEEDFRAEEAPVGESVLASPVAASPPASQRRMRRSGIRMGMGAGPILPPPSPQ
ncbi:MAG: RcpC/CpaB family pilus assembly protein [Isosphaeraceae bacterium]